MDTPSDPPQAAPHAPSSIPGAAPARPRQVFLSYRRRDAKDIAGRIHDHLSVSYGRKNVFQDVNSIIPGARFKDVVRDAIGSCDAFLLLLSPHWAAIEEDGRRRIDDPEDLYRQEIEAALARQVPLFPVLVGGAVMPEEEELPPSLRPLTGLHAATVRSDPDFRTDMASLLAAVHAVAPPNPRLWARWVLPLAVILLFSAAALAVQYLTPPRPVLRVLPSGQLFLLLSREKGDAWRCCRLTLRTDGREPLEIDLMQAALYLGAGEREVKARLAREGRDRDELYDAFLDAAEVSDPEDREDWKRSWSESRVEPRWKLVDGQTIEMIVSDVDGCELHRQQVTVEPDEWFQTEALGQDYRSRPCP